MKVSVIVPNHGRDISSIKKVVDNMPDVEFLEVDLGFERSYQRNIGIAQAKGEYIFILDSDQLPTETLILECIHIMEVSKDTFKEINAIRQVISCFCINTPEELVELNKLLDRHDKELRRLAKLFNMEHLLSENKYHNLN